MPKDRSTQYTPQGLEIPVPSRKQVENDLAKAMQPEPKPSGKRKPGGSRKK